MSELLAAPVPLGRVHVDPHTHWFRPWATTFGRDGGVIFVPLAPVDVEALVLARHRTVSGASAWHTTWWPPFPLVPLY